MFLFDTGPEIRCLIYNSESSVFLWPWVWFFFSFPYMNKNKRDQNKRINHEYSWDRCEKRLRTRGRHFWKGAVSYMLLYVYEYMNLCLFMVICAKLLMSTFSMLIWIEWLRMRQAQLSLPFPMHILITWKMSGRESIFTYSDAAIPHFIRC